MRLTRTKLRYALARTPVRSFVVALRHLGLRRDDAFLSAYPRSGSTWVKFLLYEGLTGQAAGFEVSSNAIPHIGRHRRAPTLLGDGGRLLKTHERHRPEYRKAIYVVRDFRDVVRSEHAFFNWRGMIQGGDFDAFLRKSLDGRTHGFGFGSWRDHVRSWLDAHDDPRHDVHVVQYESLRKDPVQGLGALLEFLGAPVSVERAREIVEHNALERMREKEDAVRDRHAPFKTNDRNYEGGLRFVRSGSVGGWQEELSAQQIHAIESRLGPLFERLAYPVTTAS